MFNLSIPRTDQKRIPSNSINEVLSREVMRKKKYNLFDVTTNPPNQDHYKCKEVSQESRQYSPLE